MKTLKLFTLLALAVLTSAVGWGNNVYVKVTSADQLQAGKKYILAYQGEDRNGNVGGTMVHTYTIVGRPGGGNFTKTNPSIQHYIQEYVFKNGAIVYPKHENGEIELTDNELNTKVTVFELSGEQGSWTFRSINSADIVNDETTPANNMTNPLLTMACNRYSPNSLKVSDYQRLGLLLDNWAANTNYNPNMSTWTIEETEKGYRLINNYVAVGEDNKHPADTAATRTVMQAGSSGGFYLYGTENKNAAYTAYLFVQKDPVTLLASTNSLNLHKDGQATFTVTGENLTEDVTLTFDEGATEGLRFEPSTLSKEDVMAEGGAQVTVYYEGTAHDANGIITVSSSGKTTTVKVTAQSSGEWTTIYIPKSAGDYYIWAWDANGTTPGQPHNYFEKWPGKKISELQTANLGVNDGNTAGVEFYTFEFDTNATGLGLVFNAGENASQTIDITPKDHEIYYWDGTTDANGKLAYKVGIPIDEVIFPDDTFRKYLKSTKFHAWNDGKKGEQYDKPYEYNGFTNVTGILEPEDLEGIDVMLITTDTEGSLYSFKGLEYFNNLKEVDLIAGGSFNLANPELDLTTSPSLEILKVHSAQNMTSLALPTSTIKVLELSNCDALPVGNLNQCLATYAGLEKLTIDNCELINSVNVEQNLELTHLKLSAVPIPSLNLQNNSKLISLYLGSTAITSDNLNQNIAQHEKLQELYIHSNEQLTSNTIDLSKHSDLNMLQVTNQKNFTSFDLTNNKKMNYLVMQELNNLETLTIPSDLTTLEHLWIEKNGKLKNHTFDLTNNLGLIQMSINFLGGNNVIKGVSNKMKDIRYISTESQRYEGNILNLEGCAQLHHLDVMNCDLSALNVKNCTALGSKNAGNDNTAFYIPGNNLRSLDLTGVELPYNYNMSPSTEDGNWVPANSPFMPEDYMYHVSYNDQSTAALTDPQNNLAPNVALVYHDRWAATPNYTYLVYVRLDKNENDKNSEGKVVPTLNELFNQEARELYDSDTKVDVAFDYKRVKLWSRFTNRQEGPVLDVHGTKEIHAISGVEAPTWASEEYPDLTQVDPTHVLGNILSLGMYTVPCGHDRRYHETTGAEGTTADVEDAYVGGRVSYFYSTREWSKGTETPQDEPAPMPRRANGTGADLDTYKSYNGETIDGSNAEVEYYKGLTLQDNTVVEQYNNAIPFNFDWEVMLNNKPEQIVTAIDSVRGDQVALIQEIQYYNTLGMMSHKPFEGVNIVVTRYSNGTTTTTKIVK